MIQSQNLRKTQTSCNSEPKNQFITQRNHHGWKINEPYLEIFLEGKSWIVFPFTTKNRGAYTTTRAEKPNASMARVTCSRVA
jgi:hypothetical protein